MLKDNADQSVEGRSPRTLTLAGGASSSACALVAIAAIARGTSDHGRILRIAHLESRRPARAQEKEP